MNVVIKPAPIRKSVRVKTGQAQAFDLFTTGMGSWWLKKQSILPGAPQKTVVVEPRTGGRWYEVGEDGSECEWGRVLAWDRPGRVVLAWQIDATWQFVPALVTEIEVRFTADGDSTLVDFEHRNLERFGERAENQRQAMDGGWAELLDAYASAEG